MRQVLQVRRIAHMKELTSSSRPLRLQAYPVTNHEQRPDSWAWVGAGSSCSLLLERQREERQPHCYFQRMALGTQSVGDKDRLCHPHILLVFSSSLPQPAWKSTLIESLQQRTITVSFPTDILLFSGSSFFAG